MKNLKVYSCKELQMLFDVSKSTVYKWRKLGFLTPMVLGKQTVRYAYNEVATLKYRLGEVNKLTDKNQNGTP